MVTHHGRPGGRLVELLAGFALIVISTAALLGAMAMIVLAYYTVMSVHAWLGIGFLMAFFVALQWWGKVIGPPVARAIKRGLAALWMPYLNYYGYEAHSLRPIKEDETHDRDAH